MKIKPINVWFTIFVAVLLLFYYFQNRGSSNQLTSSQIPVVVLTDTIPKFDHIIVIVMENKSLASIINNKHAPFINSLASNNVLIKNYHGIAHPSLPNYIALISGDTQGITSDCINCFVSSKNLVDSFEENSISWRAYMESMPNECYIGNFSEYAQKHNPFIYFDNIRLNKDKCSKIVPYSYLSKDLNLGPMVPKFIWITPNLCNDMHNCSISQGDKWLSEQLPIITKSDIFANQNSVLFLFWEEDNGTRENQVPMIILGSKYKASYDTSKYYDHYSLLHTIEAAWNLPALTNNDANAYVFTFSLK